jgi:hypothetical protein
VPKLFDSLRDASDGFGSEDKIYRLTFSEKSFAFELSDAAENAENRFFFLPVGSRFIDLPDAREKFMLGFLANRTGIHKTTSAAASSA